MAAFSILLTGFESDRHQVQILLCAWMRYPQETRALPWGVRFGVGSDAIGPDRQSWVAGPKVRMTLFYAWVVTRQLNKLHVSMVPPALLYEKPRQATLKPRLAPAWEHEKVKLSV